MTTTDVELHHVLQGQRIKKIESWAEWLALWQAAENVEILTGLVHCGFEVPYARDERYMDRVFFYLDLADGYNLSDLYPVASKGNEAWESKTLKEELKLHTLLSRKALKVLIRTFFAKSEHEERDRRPKWLYDLEQPGALEKVLWFLRSSERHGMHSLHNVPRWTIDEEVSKHLLDQLRAYALRLVKGAWGYSTWNYSGVNRHIDKEVLQRFRAARPQFIRILVELDRLYIFRDRDHYPLDEGSKEALLEIALGNEARMRNPETGQWESRHPVDLQEAFAYGSKAADILLREQMFGEAEAKANRLIEIVRGRAELEAEAERLRGSAQVG